MPSRTRSGASETVSNDAGDVTGTITSAAAWKDTQKALRIEGR